MKQEDKELLLQDLCGRLPYGVRGERVWTAPVSGSPEKGIYMFDTFDIKVLTTGYYDCGEYGFREVKDYSFKPYLFPLSSMTEEQCEKFKIISGWDGELEDIKRGKFSCIGYIGLDYIYDTIDWLNKNHFDYRGLIEKSLALDASGLNIY